MPRFGIFATKSGGCLVLVGLGKPEVSIPIVNAAVREVKIKQITKYKINNGLKINSCQNYK